MTRSKNKQKKLSNNQADILNKSILAAESSADTDITSALSDLKRAWKQVRKSAKTLNSNHRNGLVVSISRVCNTFADLHFECIRVDSDLIEDLLFVAKGADNKKVETLCENALNTLAQA